MLTREVTHWASSSAKAARSAADAKRTSPSMANVATRFCAFAAPVIRVPTSRTSCAASASNQRADSRSGDLAGSGCTADSAVGEITNEAAAACITRSVTLPFLRSSTSSTNPCRSSVRRW
ncbi:hypothetical protein GCM10020220_006160 [Nonomuraea rubra]|uniref:hypothetical protein n=1 Tax=Nonomuraea rubra TaxID=46180 RepID=UPI0031EB702A